MQDTNKTTETSMVVTNENELNNVITEINSGSQTNLIDVQSSFSLTADTTHITQNLTLSSSNNSIISDAGFAALYLKKGAQVTLSMSITGTGTSIIDGSGDDSTLIGVTGGEIANLNIINGGALNVPLNQTFKTAAIDVDAAIGAGANISGVLNNTQPMTLSNGIIENPDGQGQLNELNMYYESFLKLSANSTFKAEKITVNNICQISSDGTAQLNVSQNIIAKSTSWVYSGIVQGVNVNTLTLEQGGVYHGANGFQSKHGCTVETLENNNGTFNLGQNGTWNCHSYTHKGNASLEAYLPNFNGDAPTLNITEQAIFSGGTIDIHSIIHYLPSHATGGSFVLITAPSGQLSGITKDMIKFHHLPSKLDTEVIIKTAKPNERDQLIIRLIVNH